MASRNAVFHSSCAVIAFPRCMIFHNKIIAYRYPLRSMSQTPAGDRSLTARLAVRKGQAYRVQGAAAEGGSGGYGLPRWVMDCSGIKKEARTRVLAFPIPSAIRTTNGASGRRSLFHCREDFTFDVGNVSRASRRSPVALPVAGGAGTARGEN